jgi:hypothetical protein
MRMVSLCGLPAIPVWLKKLGPATAYRGKITSLPGNADDLGAIEEVIFRRRVYAENIFKFESYPFAGHSTLVVLLAMPTFAQTSRGTVSGAVTDSSGGIIPGVRVELTNRATGVVRSTITNEAGLYRFDAVDLGDYTLKIAMPSFKTYTSSVFHVEANRTITIDAKLEVGGGEIVVQVSAESAELLIKDAPIRGGNFKPQEVSQLPLAGLSPISLARTLPGVILPSGSTTFGNGGGAGALVAVNGQRPRGNNNLLDGTENNDISVGGPAQGFNMLDAVQEFSAQTGNFGVEFGRAGGGVFNIITKSGTNNYHGTAIWQYRSQRFN